MTQLLHADITEKAWRAYYTNYNAHGHDYPESFYEEMMRIELEHLGLSCRTQVEYNIHYKGVKVGVHLTDTELDDKVILEYKVVPKIQERHCMQLVSYLKASGKEAGLVLNFGCAEPDGKRRVLTEIGKIFDPVWNPDDPIRIDLLYPEPNMQLRHAAWTVYNELGSGFVRRIYGNALHTEIRLRGIAAYRLGEMKVIHRGQEVGALSFPHIIVDKTMVVAPIANVEITHSHLNRLRVVLRQRGLHLGMIVNFANEKLEMRYVRV
ncbi:MAG: GxxExxY protein [Chloroflexota bacterium]